MPKAVRPAIDERLVRRHHILLTFVLLVPVPSLSSGEASSFISSSPWSPLGAHRRDLACA